MKSVSFEKFIADNFCGMTTMELFDSLCIIRENRSHVSNMIYVDFFHVYLGVANAEEIQRFNNMKGDVRIKKFENGLAKNPSELNILFMIESILNGTAYNADAKIEYLKDNCLDWYLEKAIDLDVFKMIIALK